MRIFGLSGKKRVGKDTVASILSKKHGFLRFSFADNLKQLCSDALEMPMFYFFEDEFKDTKVLFELLPRHVDNIEQLTGLKGLKRDIVLFETPRDALQYVGTDLVRAVDDKYWINLLLDQIKQVNCDVVVTDARFSNERKALKDAGGTNILITRNTNINDTHISENDLGEPEEYDVVINNDGRLTELERDIELWMTHVRNKQV